MVELNWFLYHTYIVTDMNGGGEDHHHQGADITVSIKVYFMI